VIRKKFVLRELAGIQQSPSCASALVWTAVRGYSLLRWSCLQALLCIGVPRAANWSAFLDSYVFTFHENTCSSTYAEAVPYLRQKDFERCVLL
jgi:hypothetical protein